MANSRQNKKKIREIAANDATLTYMVTVGLWTAPAPPPPEGAEAVDVGAAVETAGLDEPGAPALAGPAMAVGAAADPPRDMGTVMSLVFLDTACWMVITGPSGLLSGV